MTTVHKGIFTSEARHSLRQIVENIQRRWERAQRIGKTATVFSQDEYEEAERDFLLMCFAQKRGVDLCDPDWRVQVRLIAVSEHPELQPGRKYRGRPSKPSLPGLVGAIYTELLEKSQAEQLVYKVDREMEGLYRRGLSGSESAAIEAMVIREGKHSKGSPAFEAACKKIGKTVGAARKLLGKSLPVGRKKRPTNSAK